MSWMGLDEIFLSTSLASYLDEKLIVLLRDGRKLLGILRSFDQFVNAVIEGACEGVIVGDLFCDIPLGLYVIRGENVVLIGELVKSFPSYLFRIVIANVSTFNLVLQDPEKEVLPSHMTCVSAQEIRKAQKAEREATGLKGSMRKRMEFLDLE